ncbi:MAG: hypothetical protein Q9175_004257 [Cornicularia normoerica]
MTIKLRLDAGKLTMPSLALDFRISKTGKNSSNKDDYNTFRAGWEPGGEIAGKYMMEHLQFHRPDDAKMTDHVFPLEIRELVKKNRKRDSSNAHKSNIYDSSWPLNLQGAPAQQISENLLTLVEGSGSHAITIWFMVPAKHLSYFNEGCLSHLKYAVQEHLAPNHMDRDEHGDPLLSYRMLSIRTFGSGMYVRYPLIPGPNGIRVPTKQVASSFINLPKKHVWVSLKTLHIYYGVSNVREQQYNIGQRTSSLRGWPHVHPERMPVWSIAGKGLTPDKSLFKSPDAQLFNTDGLRPFIDGVNNYTPSFHQYLDEGKGPTMRGEIVLVAEKMNYPRGMKSRQVQKLWTESLRSRSN